MALSESIEYDKIEVVGPYTHVQVRKATVIKRDGVEIQGSRSYLRYMLDAGTLDASDNLVPTDITEEPTEIQTICNAVWTNEVKEAWKNKLISAKDPFSKG